MKAKVIIVNGRIHVEVYSWEVAKDFLSFSLSKEQAERLAKALTHAANLSEQRVEWEIE